MAALVAALFAATPRPADGCTTFMLADRWLAKSYDWSMGQGLVFINKRGVDKRALVLDPKDRPARWVSRYGSVTFNQYGRELPNGGMNEAGLVVEVMWLDGTVYPRRDARPTVNELQWIQYQLDRYATVREMVEHRDELRVAQAHGKVHYLACDRAAECAAFENLRGKWVVTHGKNLTSKTLTNHSYADAVAFQKKARGSRPSGTGSLARFVRAAALSRDAKKGSVTEATAFSILDAVRVPGRSQWNIVYSIPDRRVHFRTRRASHIKSLRLDAFDFACGSPVKTLDIDARAPGSVDGRFEDYSVVTNITLVRASLEPIRKALPWGAIQKVADYPTTTACAKK